MHKTIGILSSMLRNRQAYKMREYTKEDIQTITRELNVDILTLLNYLIDFVLDQRNNKIAWMGNESPLQKIQIVLLKRKESIEKPRRERCSLQDFEALAKYLQISKQELLERMITVLFDTYEENVRLIGTIEGLKDDLYVMNYKNRNLQAQLNSRENVEGTTIKAHKQNVQAELVRQGIKPARKSYVSLQVINKLKNQGLSNEEIADRLEVSRSTIWRRIKEGEAAAAAKGKNGVAKEKNKETQWIPF